MIVFAPPQTAFIQTELDVGSLYRTKSLVVTDSFGVRTALRPAGELPERFSTWRMFEHSPLRGNGVTKPTANMFFLPPTLVKSLITAVYKLATEVPDYWVPFVPVKRDTGLRLKRARLLKLDGKEEFVEAHGSILNSGDTQRLDIFEEEIPREGIRVTRSYQLTRWHDDSTHLWIGRRKRVGSGEGIEWTEIRFAVYSLRHRYSQ